ncbi:hypothetical protein FKW77_003196 [Venturia effusa]|uniref:Uncharacterized protein n=1 Tax=Venturia effusa TaxID=50376 RepID=A0A517LF47_9PEZI|nr:hypothetical protein FKW77_003196 [Venturia effusa]
MDVEHRKEVVKAETAKWNQRKIDLLLVNRQLYREAGRIFWRKNEFRFQHWNELGNLPFLAGHEHDVPNDVSSFVCSHARFSKFQSIRRISVIGGGWYDQVEYGPEDYGEKDRTSYYSSGIASFLFVFPNLTELTLGVGMVSTFMDNATELGQWWQAILNVLRRNDGILKVNLRHLLDDHRGDWWFNNVQAKATIALPAKGVVPLRETVWTMQDLAIMAQIWINTHKPSHFVKLICRGAEHTVWLIGVPLNVVRPIALQRIRKSRAKKLKHAQHIREGCACEDCKIMERTTKIFRMMSMTPLEKMWRHGQTSASAQLQSKWARNIDLSYDEEELIEAQGSVSVNGIKGYVRY